MFCRLKAALMATSILCEISHRTCFWPHQIVLPNSIMQSSSQDDILDTVATSRAPHACVTKWHRHASAVSRSARQVLTGRTPAPQCHASGRQSLNPRCISQIITSPALDTATTTDLGYTNPQLATTTITPHPNTTTPGIISTPFPNNSKPDSDLAFLARVARSTSGYAPPSCRYDATSQARRRSGRTCA